MIKKFVINIKDLFRLNEFILHIKRATMFIIGQWAFAILVILVFSIIFTFTWNYGPAIVFDLPKITPLATLSSIIFTHACIIFYKLIK